MMKASLIVISGLLFFGGTIQGYGQQEKSNVYTDSLAEIFLEDFSIVEDDAAYWEKFRDYRKYTVRVYPYAMLAVDLMEVYNEDLAQIDKRRKRKKYSKAAYKELKESIKVGISSMTIPQGIVLMKIINRETGKQAYDIIKEYLGPVKAFYWQSICRVGGTSLKLDYDPNGEDIMIETILQRIENGQITIQDNEPWVSAAKWKAQKKENRRLARSMKKETSKKAG